MASIHARVRSYLDDPAYPAFASRYALAQLSDEPERHIGSRCNIMSMCHTSFRCMHADMYISHAHRQIFMDRKARSASRIHSALLGYRHLTPSNKSPHQNVHIVNVCRLTLVHFSTAPLSSLWLVSATACRQGRILHLPLHFLFVALCLEIS